MKLSDFDYQLPKGLIAQYPLKKRDAARLLVVRRKDNKIEHGTFEYITDYLNENDLLVLNDTKVLASRLNGRRASGGKVQVLLVERIAGSTFNALIKPIRVKVGEKINFTPLETIGRQEKDTVSLTGFNGGGLTAKLTAKNEITFNTRDSDSVYRLGMMPLPPYIKRDPEEQDFDYYQTVYAKEEGAIASPTAGLHFTRELLRKITKLGVRIAYTTLHVGYSTFRPVKTDDMTEHRMDKEYFRISDEGIALIEKARKNKERLIAVGTTSCRSLETYASGVKEGYTDLFIYPGYKFKMVDCLLTNFHLPKTTLFMLVCAFAGEKLIKKAYREAIDRKYRFYSYGDAMLII